MAQSLCSPLRLVCSNTRSSGLLPYSANKVNGLQLLRRQSHSKKLDWHRLRISAVAGDSKVLQTHPDQESIASLTTVTEPNSSSNIGKADSLPTFEKGAQGEKDMSMEKLIVEIKEIFNSMEDGDISASAYDTAWVARVPAIDGSGQPQFPQTLEWIVNNQLADGSWGDDRRFLASDRFLNTLACLITLTIWNTGHIQVQRGLEFIKTHAELMMKEALGNHGLLKGFEMVFPALLKEAKLLGLDLPDYDSSVLKQTLEQRDSQLKKISTEDLHAHPSSMLYYVEGIQEIIDWQKILKLQSGDGSFLGSPASTACVYMHTGDKKCLQFLTGLLAKFEDHVPCMYPVDISERLRAVDTVERLGLERHFEAEIKQALDYVFKHWNPNGLGFGRDSLVPDIEVTANGLRLLRMYRYKVSSDVLDKLYAKEVGKFSGDPKLGGLVDVFSLFRCSQVNFPGEKIMPQIRAFAKDYLAKYLQSNDISHVEAVKKNLKKEIQYGLQYPWNRNMPRLMYRNSIENFSSDDLWQGKTLYHMPNVSNEKYRELAKLDFNYIQAVHRADIPEIKRWYKECNFPQLAFTRHREVAIYWTASVVMFEPEYSACRLNYAKAGIMAVITDDLYDSYASVPQANLFNDITKRWDPSLIENLPDDMKIVFMGLYNSLHEIGEKGRQFHGYDVEAYLVDAWWSLFTKYTKELEWAEAKYSPSLEEYWKNAIPSIALGVTTLTPIFSTGEPLPEDLLALLDFRKEFLNLVGFTGRLINDVRTFMAERDRGELASCVQCYINDHPGCTEEEALNYMYDIDEEALVKLNYEFLNPDSNIPKCYRTLLFNTARVMQLFYRNIDGFFYSENEMKEFMQKCLFEPVE